MEYLFEYNRDGSIAPNLLEGWSVSEDAKTYVLKVRKGVKWNNGDDFTAEDVARNIEGWCDKSVEGNSMAGRMASLIDPDTGKAAAGAIKVVSHKVELTCVASDITVIAGMADCPAAVVHSVFSVDIMATNPVPWVLAHSCQRATKWALRPRWLKTKRMIDGAILLGEPYRWNALSLSITEPTRWHL